MSEKLLRKCSGLQSREGAIIAMGRWCCQVFVTGSEIAGSCLIHINPNT